MMNWFPLIVHQICLHPPAFRLLFYFISYDSVRNSSDQLSCLPVYQYLLQKHFNYTGNANKLAYFDYIHSVFYYLEANRYSSDQGVFAFLLDSVISIQINSGEWKIEREKTAIPNLRLFESFGNNWNDYCSLNYAIIGM